MIVKKFMKRNVISVRAGTAIRSAAALMAKHHIGLLPVVDKEDKTVGVLDMHDMLTLELPDFVKFVGDVDFVHDFGAVETTRPSAGSLSKKVDSLMEEPVTVPEDCGLLRAYALMMQHEIHDMPVVSKDGRLIGIISRVDIGAAILKAWEQVD